VPLTATWSPPRAAREYDAMRSNGLPLLTLFMARTILESLHYHGRIVHYSR
jgi:hypothetical protein